METLDINWIDTHCHLYAAEFDADRQNMIQSALDAHVSMMMLPNIDMDSIKGMMDLVDQYPGSCFPMLGLHPCSVSENYKDILIWMKNEILEGGFLGIGETGIDLYWETKHKAIQINAFEEQINWAKELDLPIIIHSRESLDLNIQIIKDHQDGRLRGIFHCFGGDYAQAIQIHKLGFKIGIGGVLTFKTSTLRELLPQLPSEMIVLESDAPYLAPVPYRGKRNESAYIPLIGRAVAESLHLSLSEVAKLTSANAMDVFGKKG